MDDFSNRVWLAFQCLMDGCLLVKYETIQAENIWCVPSDTQTSPNYYYIENVVKVLLKEGIVIESDDLPADFNFANFILKRYILTERGKELSNEFRDMPPEKAMYDFLSRITVTREDMI